MKIYLWDGNKPWPLSQQKTSEFVEVLLSSLNHFRFRELHVINSVLLCVSDFEDAVKIKSCFVLFNWGKD